MDYQLAKKLMKEAGYKITGQRKLVFEVLEEHDDEHLTPEEIHKYVSEKNDNIGIATVYRTLLLFDRLGIVQKLNIDDSGARYELVNELEEHHHHHLICIKCSGLQEVEDDLLIEVEEKIQKSHDFKIKNHELKFFGVCKNCRDD
ncbi:MAG: Fur family transcriptional regulator [Tissierellia bacterium]|nr:Fur family transcriptional regulator [Tissierellia bacterium]